MKFTYSSGARPLDGYTIKRGIGHGGFGEVYYALSDGGKEVALKLVRNNLDVELRGVAQCLNLKHPNLVELYDIKTDSQADPWIIMEYVSGESLNNVVNRHPNGLSLDLARQWFLGIARGIGYLHDQGIVHRDLKPGNIFLENGIVKICDYGLSKFISCSQRSAQTQSVGTVHYMAPEVSTGKYGKAIDIYAAGIILYEMLTGHVPFQGESAGEILMKHLTAPPDLTKLPTEYRGIVGKALAKDPEQRYASFGEMSRAVESIGRRAAGASPPMTDPQRGPCLSPPTAEPVREVAVNGGLAPVAHQVPEPEPPFVVPVAINLREKFATLSGSMVAAAFVAATCGALWTMLEVMLSNRNDDSMEELFGKFSTLVLLVTASSWLVLLPAKFWEGRRGDQWLRRAVMFVMGLGLGVATHWVNGWSFTAADGGFPSRLFASMSYFGLAFFVMRWWKMADPKRPQRFSVYSVVLAGCLGYLLMLIPAFRDNGGFRSESIQAPDALVLVLTAIIVQVTSGWQEPPPRTVRRARLRYG